VAEILRLRRRLAHSRLSISQAPTNPVPPVRKKRSPRASGHTVSVWDRMWSRSKARRFFITLSPNGA
jgi:hypothetical protein